MNFKIRYMIVCMFLFSCSNYNNIQMETVREIAEQDLKCTKWMLNTFESELGPKANVVKIEVRGCGKLATYSYFRSQWKLKKIINDFSKEIDCTTESYLRVSLQKALINNIFFGLFEVRADIDNKEKKISVQLFLDCHNHKDFDGNVSDYVKYKLLKFYSTDWKIFVKTYKASANDGISNKIRKGRLVIYRNHRLCCIENEG
ncbi:MAG: hypothetical protein GY760_15540 [Deltaproteobacteria bacterium]|nr:hypothetical protein [Deltaproteobacteria bacterium]